MNLDVPIARQNEMFRLRLPFTLLLVPFSYSKFIEDKSVTCNNSSLLENASWLSVNEATLGTELGLPIIPW